MHERTRRRGVPAALLLAVTVALMGTACSKGAASPGTSTPQTRPSSTAQLSLVSPTQGQVFTTGTIPVKVSLKDATIVPTTSTNLKPNEGHLHLYLDNQIVSMNYQSNAVLHDVKSGQHLLRVEFVATDHAPFDPRVVVQVTFKVQP